MYLQRVVEHVTATPFEEYIQRELFEPLGMTSGSYVWQGHYDQLAAAGHDKNGKVKQNRRRFEQAHAGYSLYCTR